MNKLLLKYFMAQHQDTNDSLAEKIGIGKVSFSNKMNELGRSRFNIQEVAKIREIYQLEDKDFLDIFFK